MSFEKAKAHLEKFGFDDRIHTFDVSSATVELAAKALGCESALIAKTLSFDVDGKCVLVVTSGDCKIDNAKFKAFFSTKAKMIDFERVEEMCGHATGGVCPFGINEGVLVYLDESMKRFAEIFPACGSSNSAVRLTPYELEKCSNSSGWVDVCKIKE